MDLDKIYDVFTIGHVIFVIIVAIFISFMFIISSKLDKKQIIFQTKILAIILIILEVIKIKYRINKGVGLDGFVPLTFFLLPYVFTYIIILMIQI